MVRSGPRGLVREEPGATSGSGRQLVVAGGPGAELQGWEWGPGRKQGRTRGLG